MKILSADGLFESNRPAWIAIAGLITCTCCWIAHRSSSSRYDAMEASGALLQRMQEDATRIAELKEAPRIATERVRPNDELIRQVQSALAAAGIPLENWTGNEPSPPVRLPQTPYKQLSVRLLFEQITMRQLVQFAFQLTSDDPTLTIDMVRFAPPTERLAENWNVDITIQYLLYSPRKEEQ